MGRLTLILLILFTCPAFAASRKAPGLASENDVTGPIPTKTLNDVYENCLFHIPRRFTPDAREYYCTCNAAGLQANFSMNEYAELQKPANRRPGNRIFEKYIHTAVAPCLDVPVKQIEYLACLIDSSDDIRIGSPTTYCSCVSGKMQKHARSLGEAELMTKLAENTDTSEDPANALWNNQTYMTTKYKSRDDCLIEGK